MPLHYSFAGKKVLITGGGQGIGRTLVQKFRDDGAKVFTLDKNEAAINKLQVELPDVQAEMVDLTDWEATRKVVESFGPVDCLVNNAGIVELKSFMDVTKGSANLHFDVNVVAAVNVTQTMSRMLIKIGKEGTVVNISSSTARIVNHMGTSMYAASKAALENLTKSMALELGQHGIRVNCVVPGYVNTPMVHTHTVNTEVNKYVEGLISERLIIKRLVEPAEICDAVMFLLSPLSQMITGQSVVIDGGLLVD